MMRKNYTAKGIAAVGPYSHAVDAVELVFLSGQTPIDPATGKLVAGGIAEQTLQALSNVSAILGASGLTLDNVVKSTVYLTDMGNFAAMNEVYGKQFANPYPARTTVGVLALPLGALVEIEVVAQK